EKYQQLIDDYRGLNNDKFQVEFVDPYKEATRAQAAQIRRLDTLVLDYNGKQSKVEEPNEEKLTNALIKLTQGSARTLCVITGHGEKSFEGNDEQGYATAKKGLTDQSYEIKPVSLAEQKAVPAECSAVAMIGPKSALFAPEVKALSDYLAAG